MRNAVPSCNAFDLCLILRIDGAVIKKDRIAQNVNHDCLGGDALYLIAIRRFSKIPIADIA